MYREFVSSEFTSNEVPDSLYQLWLTLSNIPKKDWGKAETLDKVQEAVDNL